MSELPDVPPPGMGYQPKTAAQLLDVPVKTVRTLMHAGELGHTKVGRYYVIPHSELERLLDPARKAVA
jgi:excisionase family DNA binding protein